MEEIIITYLPKNYLKLCLVTNWQNQSSSTYHSFLEQVVQGGVSLVQFRDKISPFDLCLERAKKIKQWLTPFKIPLIVNDSLKLAEKIDADGLHLGATDSSPNYARSVLGTDKIIGLSIESLHQLTTITAENINYIAASAVFHSNSKSNCNRYWGIKGLKDLISKTQIPLVAIGGININNLSDIWKTGVHGIAVIEALHNAKDPMQMAKDLIAMMQPK